MSEDFKLHPPEIPRRADQAAKPLGVFGLGIDVRSSILRMA